MTQKFFTNELRSKSAYTLFIISALLLPIISGCARKAGPQAGEAYLKEIRQWQEARSASLASENGWLTLCGLFWLKEGENTFGSDSSNNIIFPPGKAPKLAGSIWLEGGTLKLAARAGADIRCRDSLVKSMVLQSDEEGASKPTVLTTGSLSFHVIKRSGQMGVRVKDKENPDRINFKGLEYFPLDDRWRIQANFEPYNPPKVIQIATVINTVGYDTSFGALLFDLDGKHCRLDAISESGSQGELLVMFSDETSGYETYGLGRQLYTSRPSGSGGAAAKVLLDFNKAYNWPCAYTEFATCPIPPRQNHLGLRVEAGEKKYAGSKH